MDCENIKNASISSVSSKKRTCTSRRLRDSSSLQTLIVTSSATNDSVSPSVRNCP